MARALQKHLMHFRRVYGASALACLLTAFGAYYCHRQLATLTWHALHIPVLSTALNPADAVLARDIGVYNFSSKRYDLPTSEHYLRRALTLDPHLLYVHFELGRIAFIKGDFATAVSEANKELEVNPTFPNSYYLRGLIYAYAGALDAAVADFKTFLSEKPQSWAGHNDLAWVYFRQGEYEQAAHYAAEGLEGSPRNPWLENTLGTALLNLGSYEEARTHLEVAKAGFDAMPPGVWGSAYPGNDPRVYEDGLAASRSSVDENLALIEEKLQSP